MEARLSPLSVPVSTPHMPVTAIWTDHYRITTEALADRKSTGNPCTTHARTRHALVVLRGATHHLRLSCQESELDLFPISSDQCEVKDRREDGHIHSSRAIHVVDDEIEPGCQARLEQSNFLMCDPDEVRTQPADRRPAGVQCMDQDSRTEILQSWVWARKGARTRLTRWRQPQQRPATTPFQVRRTRESGRQ